MFDGLVEGWKDRGQSLWDIAEQVNRGERSYAELALAGASNSTGAIFDVPAAAIGALVPDSIKEGFSDIEVERAVDYLKDAVYVTITIEEGRRYFLGDIKIEGNKEVLEEEIRKAITIKGGDIFQAVKVDMQALKIQGVYFDRGYIFAKVEPLSFFNAETEKVDVTFNIVENEIAYVEGMRLSISQEMIQSDLIMEKANFTFKAFDCKPSMLFILKKL